LQVYTHTKRLPDLHIASKASFSPLRALLVKSGAKVSLADKDKNAVEELAKSLGPNAWGYAVDVTKRNEVEHWVSHAASRWNMQGLDGERTMGIRKTNFYVRKDNGDLTDDHEGAVNLAGIAGPLDPVTEHSTAIYEAVFAVNVEGTFNCMSA
jgi:NAD(P)-dependent dehydrogenase (short-subunit alcohol dehydrogenase family)